MEKIIREVEVYWYEALTMYKCYFPISLYHFFCRYSFDGCMSCIRLIWLCVLEVFLPWFMYFCLVSSYSPSLDIFFPCWQSFIFMLSCCFMCITFKNSLFTMCWTAPTASWHFLYMLREEVVKEFGMVCKGGNGE